MRRRDGELDAFDNSIAKKVNNVRRISGELGACYFEYHCEDEAKQFRVKELGVFGDNLIKSGVDPNQKVLYAFAIGKNEF